MSLCTCQSSVSIRPPVRGTQTIVSPSALIRVIARNWVAPFSFPFSYSTVSISSLTYVKTSRLVASDKTRDKFASSCPVIHSENFEFPLLIPSETRRDQSQPPPVRSFPLLPCRLVALESIQL